MTSNTRATSEKALNKVSKFFGWLTTESDIDKVIETCFTELIDDLTLGTCFENHKLAKRGTLFLDESNEPDLDVAIINHDGLDIFGQLSSKRQYECHCPNCNRTLAAARFAPHLEKCLGMGRNSSRLATKKMAVLRSHEESSSEASMNNDDLMDADFALDKRKRKQKSGCASIKKKSSLKAAMFKAPNQKSAASTAPAMASSISLPNMASAKSANSPINTSFMVNTYTLNQFIHTLSNEQQNDYLSQMCGVVSQKTGKMCCKSLRCSLHNSKQREAVRVDVDSDRVRRVDPTLSALGDYPTSASAFSSQHHLDPSFDNASPATPASSSSTGHGLPPELQSDVGGQLLTGLSPAGSLASAGSHNQQVNIFDDLDAMEQRL